MTRARRKRRKAARHRISDPGVLQSIEALKKLQRRLMAGQSMPFLIATIEPRSVPELGTTVARPFIASRGLGDERCGFLVDALKSHLAEVGILLSAVPTGAVPPAPPPDQDLDDNLGG